MQIRLGVIMLIMLLSVPCYCQGSKPKTDSAKILRCTDSKTGKMEYLGYVQYYVSRDTLFISRPFSTVGFIYSDRKTNKMVFRQISYPFANKKRDWWYVIIKKSPDAPKDAYVSIIALRNCKDVNEPKHHICWDAHLYNISKECGRSKTEGTPSASVQKLLRLIQ